MDRELFLTITVPTSSSLGAACSKSPRFSIIFSTRKKYFRAGSLSSSPPLVAADPSKVPSFLFTRNRLTSKIIPPAHQAPFGDSRRDKAEKIYTARDISLGLLDVFGWSVGVVGKGEVGKVVDIVHIGRAGAIDGSDTPYEYLLKVVRPLSSKEKTGEINFHSSDLDSTNSCDQFTTLEIKILIPIVDEFMQQIDAKRRHLQVKPPAGLLELAARPEAINRLQPEIRLFCKRYSSFLQERFSGNKKIRCKRNADFKEFVYSFMPTRDQLFAVGRPDLVRRIKDAGGFLYVANALGLRTTRRPNGFWDDVRRLDFEIECFLLESWVKCVHTETGITFFENPVTNQVMMEDPHCKDKPVYTVNGESISVTHDDHKGLKVMPRQRLLATAGRWDLHHAVLWNGGYKEVARLLGRTLIRRSKKFRKRHANMLDLVVSRHVVF